MKKFFYNNEITCNTFGCLSELNKNASLLNSCKTSFLVNNEEGNFFTKKY